MTAAGNVFGLTGGIASGKSTFAKLLKHLGARTLDADRVARDLRKDDPVVRKKIKQLFGSTKTHVIRARVFQNPPLRKRLERILIPRIIKESERRFAKWYRAHPERPIVYEASLLIETGRARDFKKLIVISSPKKDQLRRLTEKRGLDLVSARKRLEAQTSDAQRRKHADIWVRNMGSKKELKRQAHIVFDFMKRSLPAK